MSRWIFRDYLTERGENVIRQWLDSLPKQARVKIDYRVLLLQGIDRWPEQYVSALRGCDDIYELRIVANGVQYRPLGCYGPARGEFTLLLGAIEKGKKLPRSTCETASQRRVIVLANRGRSRGHEFRERTTNSSISG